MHKHTYIRKYANPLCMCLYTYMNPHISINISYGVAEICRLDKMSCLFWKKTKCRFPSEKEPKTITRHFLRHTQLLATSYRQAVAGVETD